MRAPEQRAEAVMRIAIGLSLHTGRATAVAAGGSIAAPSVQLRTEMVVVGDADRFVFHRAAEMGAAESERFLARVTETARGRAIEETARLLAALRGQGAEIAACATVGTVAKTPPSLAEIIASHARIHAAEGCFYRDVFAFAAQANGLAVRAMSAKALGGEASKLARSLAEVGRAVGRPWARDHKLGALAAWAVLAQRPRAGGSGGTRPLDG